MQHNFNQESLERHRKLKGKIKVLPKVPLKNNHDLSIFYTPGVGSVSKLLAADPEEIANYTIRHSSVAVISDGSAVLGLGNVGPEGALPVMEGKAMLFAQLAGLDAWPIVLATQDPDEIVKTIKNIAPAFGAINLEDIAAPKCFEIERRLVEELDIPVIHDDQHATAVATLAGLINAIKVTKKSKSELKITVIGAGAAGSAVTKLLHEWGVADIYVVDSHGILSKKRKDLDPNKRLLVEITNQQGREGSLESALRGTDVMIGLSSTSGLVDKAMIRSMGPDPIIFAMANPTPEILPEDAKAAGAAVVATGRSDYPNQINNVLVFPGMFKGAIAAGTKLINTRHKIAAATALAAVVSQPTSGCIIPSALDNRVILAISSVFISLGKG